MKHRPMKPETLARRARERQQSRRESRASLLRRLEEAAQRHGPDSIYAEMLTEQRKRNPGVPDEGPIEHLKNAAAIIQANLELGDKDALVADDAKAVLARIKTALRQLEERGHVYMGLSRRGNRRSVRHGNPALMVLGANPRVADATLATWAKIEYMRPDDPDGSDVVRVHEFRDGFEIAWLDDGSVQLSHPRHPLWTDDKT